MMYLLLLIVGPFIVWALFRRALLWNKEEERYDDQSLNIENIEEPEPALSPAVRLLDLLAAIYVFVLVMFVIFVVIVFVEVKQSNFVL